MRALRLCGLTLAVVTAHLIGWRIATAGGAPLAFARAGVRWIALATATSALPSVPVAATPAPGPAPLPANLAAPPPRLARPSSRAAPRTGEGGTTRHAASPAPVATIYPTRAPPTASVRYALVQDDAHTAAASRGAATLDWTRDDARFSLRVAFEAADQPAREWVSVGGFDGAGVAPSRLAERDRGRDKRAVNFDRDAGRVRFSGATQALPLAPGTQDRWSWIAQLAAIAEAADPPRVGHRAAGAPTGRAAAGTTWSFAVAGLRGEMERWTFRVLPDTALPADAQSPARTPGNDSSSGADRAPALLHLLREPERPYDLRIEVWLSPALHHLPAGLRMSTPPGNWAIALWPAPDDAVSVP